MKKDAEKFVGILFSARDFAHKSHLKTRSFAQHSALGDFYDGVIDFADKFSETWQGCNAELLDIDCEQVELNEDNPAVVLRELAEKLEELRDKATHKETYLQNIVDEILALFYSTIYKLVFLQ